MMKSSDLVLIVDSVEEAIKFYTEKLAFDLVDAQLHKEGSQSLVSAHLRKGKCTIALRIPTVEELAEFSFIKRCASRCVGLQVHMKKGLDRYFERCQKKGVKVLSEPKNMPEGYRMFSVRDPFGIKLIFSEPTVGFVAKKPTEFLGLPVKVTDATGKPRKDAELFGEMIDHLKHFGILRRAAKKYAKIWVKTATGKTKK